MQYLFLYPNNLKIPALTLLHLKKVHFWVFLQPFQSYYMYKELKVLTWTKCKFNYPRTYKSSLVS